MDQTAESDIEGANSSSQLAQVMEKIMDAKFEVVLLRRKRRILLEEIHRQFLEGECEPKKRVKNLSDLVKKKKQPREEKTEEIVDP